MRPETTERIRTHRRRLAGQWGRSLSHIPGLHPLWRDVERCGPRLQAGMDALAHAAATGQPEAFAEFAGRLSQEAFALGIPLDEVIRVLLQIKPIVLDLLADDPRGRADPDVGAFLEGMISLAVLEAIRRHERQRDRQALALQKRLDELREQARRQVLVDPVTGLFNSNYFGAAVRREIRRSRRFGRTCTIGLVALDEGDETDEPLVEADQQALLLQLVEIMTRWMRQVDIRAALGDGRFGIILPETSLEGAITMADRLRRIVERTAFVLPDHPFPTTRTVSIGLACYPRDGADEQTLLARAEEALARARVGKNTIAAAASAQDP
jgi:diguanylate cyclase (GGDEF)-like protein